MRYLVRALAVMGGVIASTLPLAATPEIWASEGWQTDFERRSVALEEIMSGGPPRDGIPPIDKPVFEPAATLTHLADREPVIQFGIDGDVRAYPLQVLTWHEIVNDTVGERPVAVTYCPLCNAAIVFDRTLDGRILDFGTTGKLRKSDLVMYDRQTESWWQQFTGEAIVGESNGAKLRLLPSRIVSFGSFRAAYPEGPVLVPNDPTFRQYGQNPYVSYETASMPFLYRGDLPDGIAPMERVVVVRTQARPIIVSLQKVRAGGFERSGYRIEWREGVSSALDAGRIEDGRDVGTVIVTKDGGDIVHDVTFAFVAHAFHPDTAIETD